MGRGACAEIYESDGWMLGRACYEEVRCDRGEGVAVYDRVEVEGGARGQGRGGIDFQ